MDKPGLRFLILFPLLVLAAGCGAETSELAPTWTATASADVLETTAETCDRHAAPAELCFMCDPALREPGRLWCNGHERYEDRCFLCHPEVEDPDRLWCSEHSLYEDECFLCHPELLAGDQPADPEPTGLYCREHDLAESECGICHPELAAHLQPGAGLKIRFESARSATLAGVETARPIVGTEHPGTSVLARVTWNENRYARVTPRAEGVLREISADVGHEVSRGELLATLSSPQIATFKSEFLSARADEKLQLSILERERELVDQQVSARRELEQAEAAYEVARNRSRAARQILLDHGFEDRALHHIEKHGTPTSELMVRAPLTGAIVGRHAVAGESVEPGHALFLIAQLDTLWLELSIPEAQVSQITTGQEVIATFDLHPGLMARAKVTWVGSSVDPDSRMIEARAEIDNSERKLRHGMFGRAQIGARQDAGTLWVPRGAVQYLDEQPHVFTRLADDLFELRRVEIGVAQGDHLAVPAGLGSADEVVVAHSFTLKSELLKSRLGAGCVDH